MISRIYKILRLVIVAILLLAVAIPSAIYIGLSLPVVQNKARHEAGTALTEMLGADVSVGNLSITPFNRLALRNVAITDSLGDTIASARRLGAGVSLTDLVFHRSLVLNYVEAIGLDLRLKRDSASAPLNIQHIITRLSRPGGDGGVPDLRINAIVVRRSSLSYDILSEPRKPLGMLDPAHIALADLRADLRIRLNKAERTIDIDLPRLAATETHSGFILSELTAKATIEKAPAPSGAIAGVRLGELSVVLPASHIALMPTEIDLLPSPSAAFELLAGSHVTPSDFRCLLPEPIRQNFASLLDSRIDLALKGEGSAKQLNVKRLGISASQGAIRVEAANGLTVEGLDSLAALAYNIPELAVTLEPSAAGLLPLPLSPVAIPGDSISFSPLPLALNLSAEGKAEMGNINMGLTSVGFGAASASVDYELTPERRLGRIDGHIEMDRLAPSLIASTVENILSRPSSLPGKLPREVSGAADISALFGTGKVPDGSINLVIDNILIPRLDGTLAELSDIILDASSDHDRIDASIDSANDGFALFGSATADLGSQSATFDLAVDDLDLSLRGGEHLSMTAMGNLTLRPASAPLPATGSVTIHDLLLARPGSDGLSLASLTIDSRIPDAPDALPTIALSSDILTATLRGSIDPAHIRADIDGIVASLFPEIASPSRLTGGISGNDFTFEARILSSAPIEKVVKLPVAIRYPVDIAASLSSAARRASLRLEAPYLWQGNKEINATALHILAAGDTASLAATTRMPTKNGMMDLSLNSRLPARTAPDASRALSTSVGWDVEAQRDFSGDIHFQTALARDDDGHTLATVDFLPGHMTFNDTVWTMDPSRIMASQGRISVDGFRVGRTGQYVAIDGVASASNADSLVISLANVDLDYVFETLNIPNAMFGGVATGELYASGLLGKNLVAYTPDLFVRGLKYNFSLMGDTHIQASFDPDAPAVNIEARVDQPNGRNSFISGYIKPTSEGYIDLDFTADRIEVGFMKPFMQAFASAVHGYASGHAHLFGTFHDVNMSGDIYAEDLSLGLDFTGTTYWATDSVHLTPGYIDLNGITLRDRDGHTARLDGYLRHTNFHEPRFQFRITDADDLLVYDLPESPDRRWYGTIYGDGAATVTGVPGTINIAVDMTTAARSTFAFVLSDAEEAYDYQFITFRDRNNPGGEASALAAALAEGIPVEVAEMRRALEKKSAEEGSSIYDMAITVHVNPLAQLTVVMDPVGGDAIRARGNGDMTLTYNSASEDLGLRGDYTLDNGTYNFTFQDIIRKDFRINQGSTIRFTGDPYAAQLDIEAAYRLTANLSDLDESFLDDPELNRTTVPVDAMIRVTGDMRAPEISYDLEFPTMKDDVKRKVNSIVSTEDMRARQMLYLLALNRFYTPEYMTATKGNELFSVASSTISSQISNVLGSLAENWTIAPNIRSDRGDFSDVEFDLALSSSLLNNRLIFNGNFGYRDKSLNNNSFIGDFDLEYLLNRSGSLRLKAYNRYNDQNFYVRNALTTQGVGIVYRRDFDSFRSWLRGLRRKKKDAPTATPSDSVSSSK